MFYGNQYKYLNLDSPWKQIVKTIKRSILVSAVIVTAGWLVCGGIAYEHFTSKPSVVFAKEIVQAPAPVLDRIADCESGNGGKKGTATHYRNGQVLIMPNTNKTVDIGYYQINSIWNKKAAELGFDLTKEADNKSFGRWLYANYGTEPWVYTKSCWNK